MFFILTNQKNLLSFPLTSKRFLESAPWWLVAALRVWRVFLLRMCPPVNDLSSSFLQGGVPGHGEEEITQSGGGGGYLGFTPHSYLHFKQNYTTLHAGTVVTGNQYDASI